MHECSQKADPELGKLLAALKEAVAKGNDGLDDIARANIRDAHKVGLPFD